MRVTVIVYVVLLILGGFASYYLTSRLIANKGINPQPSPTSPSTGSSQHSYVISVSGLSCSEDYTTWRGTVEGLGNGVHTYFDGTGCGSQSWSATEYGVQASFSPVLGAPVSTSSYTLTLDIDKDGVSCLHQSGYNVSGSC